ncbi:hypothetical protein [Streptomyces katsurahamanus]|uniref:Uncharacterized protein n=1 Tax=Streptomyces katsurahamanus TaxID=2577098 RepID=A0ABW9NMS0_9ACTN|nr:hypothetical protein [Streptomyces katsurahamanus]MQS34528.1 hypothetical protein [Streptomyces katsurahamanus]
MIEVDAQFVDEAVARQQFAVADAAFGMSPGGAVDGVAHLLCGHDRIAPSEAASVPLLLPGFSAEFVRRVLGRTVYSQPASQPQEQEAELLASLILRRALREDASGSGGVPPCERAGSLIGVRTAVPE